MCAKYDFGPIARQVYDTFLLSVPDVPVEGLYELNGQHFIVSPALKTKVHEGRTLLSWFNDALKPLGMGINLVDVRPTGAVEVKPRTVAEVIDGLGIVRTLRDMRMDLELLLPHDFPFLGVTENEDYALVIIVSRPLESEEHTTLVLLLSRIGFGGPIEVKIQSQNVDRERTTSQRLELATSKFFRNLPISTRSFLESDEDFWRTSYSRILSGKLPVEDILGRYGKTGSACLVDTIFPPQNIRTYLSLYQRIILVMPLLDSTQETLAHLGVTERELVELARMGKVQFLAPQSIERYQVNLFANILEANANAVIGSRRLVGAVHADQLAKNPLFVLGGTAFERRVILRSLQKISERHGEANFIWGSLLEGLAKAWPYYEFTLHKRGAMAGLTGPLAHISSAIARRMTGKDLFIELGPSSLNVEWASALGAHLAPFEGDEFSQIGHCRLAAAVYAGVPRQNVSVTEATSFSVAEDLLVIDNSADVIDFVTAIGRGDWARFGELVRDIAKPGRSEEEIQDIIAMWNSQIRAYERKPDRIRSMSIVGALLGVGGKMMGMPDLVSISAAVLPVIPATLTYVQEELVGSIAAVGATVDEINASLAGVRQEAVLLARLKKLVKGMK